MGDKYCIGCAHLRYTNSDPGYDTECTGGIGAEDAALSCSKGYWHEYLNEYHNLFDLERAMKSAETCADYEERPIPPDRVEA